MRPVFGCDRCYKNFLAQKECQRHEVVCKEGGDYGDTKEANEYRNTN